MKTNTLAKLIVASALSLATLSALTACDNDPGKDKAKATVSEPAQAVPLTNAATPTPGSAATTGKFAFSQADSKIEWTGAKITGKHDGAFEGFSGTVNLVDGAPEKSAVNVDIDTATLKTDPQQLTDHLKSKDFFDVATFPKAKFTSTSVRPGGEKGATHTITGNLELHGVTKGITFPATIKVDGNDVKVNAEFVINRKDFNLVYPGKPNDLIKDEVAIKLTIDAKKQP